VTNSLKNFG
jgi:hypothetical protein